MIMMFWFIFNLLNVWFWLLLGSSIGYHLDFDGLVHMFEILNKLYEYLISFLKLIQYHASPYVSPHIDPLIELMYSKWSEYSKIVKQKMDHVLSSSSSKSSFADDNFSSETPDMSSPSNEKPSIENLVQYFNNNGNN